MLQLMVPDRRLSSLEFGGTTPSSGGTLPSSGEVKEKKDRRSTLAGSQRNRRKTAAPTSSPSVPSSLGCKKMLDEDTGTYLEVNVSQPSATEEEQVSAALAQRASLRESSKNTNMPSSRRVSKERDNRRVSIRDFDSVMGKLSMDGDDDESNSKKESAVSRRAKLLNAEGTWSEAEQRSSRMHMQIVGRSGLQRLRNKLRKLRNTNEADKALSVLDEIRVAGYAPDAASYATTIQICAAAEQWKHVLKVFHDMTEERLKPDRACYITAIHAAERDNNWERAKQLLQDMQVRNLEPDYEAYYVAARACQRGEEWESTFELLTEMHEKGLVKENAVSNEAFKLPAGLVKTTHSWEDQEGTRLSLERISAVAVATGSRNRSTLTSGKNSGGTSFSGTATTSRSMSRVDSPGGTTASMSLPRTEPLSVPAQAAALAEASLDIWRHQLRAIRSDPLQWELALQIIAEMRNQGHRPDLGSYNACLSTCTLAKQWEHVLRLFREMMDDGLKPDTTNYKTAVVACERLGRWAETLDLIKEMRSRGMGGDDATYRMAIRACERGHQWDKAYSLLGEVIQRNNRLAALLPNPGEAPSSPKGPGRGGGVWGGGSRKMKRGETKAMLDSLL